MKSTKGYFKLFVLTGFFFQLLSVDIGNKLKKMAAQMPSQTPADVEETKVPILIGVFILDRDIYFGQGYMFWPGVYILEENHFYLSLF